MCYSMMLMLTQKHCQYLLDVHQRNCYLLEPIYQVMCLNQLSLLFLPLSYCILVILLYRKQTTLLFGRMSYRPVELKSLKKVLFKTAHSGMIFSGVSCKERQELDVSEELICTTRCRGRVLNRRPLSPRASTPPLSYPAIFKGYSQQNY